MDVIESIKKDKAYMKCKLIVKNWEKDFKVKNSRTPSKFDIKEAPSKIKYAYKKYFQLKSGALENSLSVCDIDETPAGSPEFIQTLEDQEVSNSQEHFLPTLPTACELDQLLSVPEKSIKIISENPFTENLSKKLFKNKTFSLRNPRKVTSKEKCLQNNDSLNKSDSSIIHEYNTFNTNSNISTTFSQSTLAEEDSLSFSVNELVTKESLLSQNNSSLISQDVRDNVKNVSVRQLNISWLERATGLPCDNTETKNMVESEKFGLRNIKLPDNIDSPCDIVENSDSDDDIVISKLKPALKKRKIDINSHIDCNSKQETNDVDINEKSNNINKPKRKTTRGRNKKENLTNTNVNKNEVNDVEPPDIREYLPFGLQEKCNPRHTNISDILSTVTNSNKKAKNNLANEDKESKLLNKIQSGTLNENFVKVNIEKKVFVRGKKSFNYSKYKKSMWKDKKSLHGGMEFPESGVVTCFKCGLPGHMARYCKAHKENSLMPLEDYQDSSDLPTLEEMQDIVNKGTKLTCTEDSVDSILYEASQVPDEVLKLLAEIPTTVNEVQPVYNHNEQNSEELFTALKKFGHTSFRPGQEEAIKRILCGKSTLLILSTGSGKSLCYQLPAYIYSQHYNCITLVISPLVSLMEDQVLNMPEFLKAGCLHTNQQPTQRRKIIELIKNGNINILLISPEALIAGDTSNGFTGLFKSLPPIAFACIDEAHCVSQWSHNFRPSYLMICRVLREKLNVKCILGLTATASQTTISSIINHINVPDGLNGVLTNPALPNNLYLSTSFEKDKDRALISLLLTERISSFNSVIVYCIRRNECERVAAVIRSCLSQPGKINMEKNKKRKRMSYIAEAYHAGMSAAQRKKIQKHFMDGSLKIIVATVAFGMGINKSDIRCIIHYNMPPSFESYVQEVGRAGRDGQPAFCHVFLSNSSSDKDELLKHIYSNSIDRPAIRKFLQKVFIPCKCGPSNNVKHDSISTLDRCKGHEVGIPIDSIVEELDLPSENIATLLCYIELHDKHYIKVLNNAYIMCKITSYGGPAKLLEATKTCPPLAMAYILESKQNPDQRNSSVLEFNVIEVAAAIGWESGMTKYHLKNLEWITVGASSQRSQLTVEFNTLGFKIRAPGDLTPNELDTMLDDLHNNVQTQEKLMLYQLEEIHKSFSQLCNSSCESLDLTENSLEGKSNELKSIINNYFIRETNVSDNIVIPERPLDVDQIAADVRAIIITYKDCSFTGRSIARIFQGISSPNYPALVWGKCRFWRSHLKEDFYGIIKIASQEIIRIKCNF